MAAAARRCGSGCARRAGEDLAHAPGCTSGSRICSPAPISCRLSSSTPKSSAPRAGGARCCERLGPEAADPIEEFLALALAYEREHVPSLQGFLHWLVAGDIEVKRDFGERQRDEVRILTVHGAKGLEAPVVFLPDTMQLPDRPDALLWSEARAALPLWCPRGDLAGAVLRRRTATRCAPAQPAGISPPALCRADPGAGPALCLRLADAHARQRRVLACAVPQPAGRDRRRRSRSIRRPLIGERDGWCGEGLRLGGPASRARRARQPARRRAARRTAAALGDGAAAAPSPTRRSRSLPSRPSGGEPPTLSPLAAAGRDRFKRGLLVHRLLQSLPELPTAERERRGAALSGTADARPQPPRSRTKSARDAGGAGPSRLRRTVGSGLAGRGAGRRA